MRRQVGTVGGALVALLVVGAMPATATEEASTAATTLTVPSLSWAACGLTEEATAADVQCAVAGLPLDYDEPAGEQVQIAVAKVPATDPANRIGSLFFNFGGPGGPAVDYLQAAGAGLFATLNERFDIVAFDPRGVGQSTPAIDCQIDEQTEQFFPSPAPTPLDVDVEELVAGAQRYADRCAAANGELLEHVSTANVARDLDALRAAVGDEKLSFLGFSYGTFLGATYASLFPDRYRAMVLDGALDPTEYINDPVSLSTAQASGFELALARFTEACAVDQVACAGFGGTDPYLAYDRLLAAADAAPLPADGYPDDPTPVTADDIRAVTLTLLYAKENWGLLAAALASAEAGDGSPVRALLDLITSDPVGNDAFFSISAGEQQWPSDVEEYLDRGAEEWVAFPHFWASFAYAEITLGLWPARDEDAFAGPFEVPATSPAPLVIGTTYDPATPYRGSLQMVEDLGNATLLTMEGDGHTAYGGRSTCIDSATEAYLVDVTLPAPGTVCTQEVPFTALEGVDVASGAGVLTARPVDRGLLTALR
jgi:pimeloyl-ACP methyl ester carboxylesterase